MTKQFEAHDQHYASKAIEPILVQEQIMDTALEVPAKARLCMVQAVRYLMRAGTKTGEDWSKELAKAENYIHRARTGEWIQEKKAVGVAVETSIGTKANTPKVVWGSDPIAQMKASSYLRDGLPTIDIHPYDFGLHRSDFTEAIKTALANPKTATPRGGIICPQDMVDDMIKLMKSTHNGMYAVNGILVKCKAPTKKPVKKSK